MKYGHIYIHKCEHCGVRLRRTRQGTNAAWYRRHGLEPQANPIRWVSGNASMHCWDARSQDDWVRGVYGVDQRHSPTLGES
jgi:hypothetical protein